MSKILFLLRYDVRIKDYAKRKMNCSNYVETFISGVVSPFWESISSIWFSSSLTVQILIMVQIHDLFSHVKI